MVFAQVSIGRGTELPPADGVSAIRIKQTEITSWPEAERAAERTFPAERGNEEQCGPARLKPVFASSFANPSAGVGLFRLLVREFFCRRESFCYRSNGSQHQCPLGFLRLDAQGGLGQAGLELGDLGLGLGLECDLAASRPTILHHQGDAETRDHDQ
jgi:hypothetical protein